MHLSFPEQHIPGVGNNPIPCCLDKIHTAQRVPHSNFDLLSVGVFGYFSLPPQANAFLFLAPVLEEIDMPLSDTLLNGSLWLGDNPPIWRGLPDSDEVNEAWDSFEYVKPIALTKKQIVAMGKDPAVVAKFDDEHWGLGDDAYVGALDFFHQVHCLNALRLEAFRYWNREGETVPKWDDIHWIHLQHCVGMLMEHLLCTADAGFITYNWIEHELHPFPDMSGEYTFQSYESDLHVVVDSIYDSAKTMPRLASAGRLP